MPGILADLFDANFKDIFFSQIVSVLGGLLAGTALALYTGKLLLIPGMLILLPGFLEMRGNISGSFALRLSSGLFLGVVKPNKFNTKIIRGNLIASLLLAVFVSLALGLLAFSFSFLVTGAFVPWIILLPVVAGIITNVVEIPLTLFATFYLFTKGHDPNNIMGPFLTSTGDVTSVISLLIAIVIIPV